MSDKTINYIKRSENYILYFAIAILPITFFSSFANVIETPKMLVLIISILLIVALKAIRALGANSIHFSSTKLDIPVLLLTLGYLASAAVETPNKMEAFFLPGTATVIVSSAVLYYIISQLNAKEKDNLKVSIFVSAVLYSLFVLFISAGVFKAIPQLPLFLQNGNFNTLGTSLPATLFLVIVAPFGVFRVIKEKDVAKKVFFGVSISLVAFAFVLNAINILPGKATSPRLPSGQISWVVAAETLKNSPLLGVGPGNYLTAFNRYRPIEYNATELWSTRFTSGRSFIFTLATEVGIAGIAAFMLLVYYIYQMLRTRDLSDSKVALTLSLLLILIFPTTSTLLVTFFIVAALASISKPGKLGLLNYDNTSDSRLPILLIVIPVFVSILGVAYYAQLITRADIVYKSSLNSLSNNNGSDAYTSLQSAINLNPYVDRYRVSYAQINLALANSIAEKEDITDQDRNTIAQLIQQAIREGKVAVTLNPQRASSWEILGSIYRSVAPLAEGAADFAVQTYTQAVNFDPLNTNTRVALGGIYYSAGAYENAIDIFKLAVVTKPDHANARYNLAVAYRENGQIQEAIAQMTLVLSLVDRDSDDFEVAKAALEELESRGAFADQAESSTNLTPPEQTEPVLDDPIELPEDAAPPEPQVENSEEISQEQEAEIEESSEPSSSETPEETPAP